MQANTNPFSGHHHHQPPPSQGPPTEPHVTLFSAEATRTPSCVFCNL